MVVVGARNGDIVRSPTEWSALGGCPNTVAWVLGMKGGMEGGGIVEVYRGVVCRCNAGLG